MSRIAALGEIMMRLSPPGNLRFRQASSFEIHYGGSEANAAAEFAQLGHEAVFLSALPEGALGDSAIACLRGFGIDCSRIVRSGSRIGLYFLENGASVRASSVIYDRAGSAFSEAGPDSYDFEKALKGADLLHLSGISPVLSRTAYEVTLAAARAAAAAGIPVSLDLNYRSRLWENDISEKQERMRTLMQYVDILFGNPLDAARCLHYTSDAWDPASGYEGAIAEAAMNRMAKDYGLRYLVASNRRSLSASDNVLSGLVSDGTVLYTGRCHAIHIVDRVGGGDALDAGFLHGILNGWGMAEALEFGLAASALKHTIPGDISFTDEAEIRKLMETGGSGRVER